VETKGALAVPSRPNFSIARILCVFMLALGALAGCGGSGGGASASTSTPSSAPTPPPTTGSATLSWVAPTTNTDGSPLTSLAGYTIYYGTNASALNQSVQITNPATVSYVFSSLSAGTWYFSIAADSNSGTESALTGAVSKTI
jgi:hypothetical protein